MENKQLKAVYNGSEVIISSGFTMQSNYVLPVLTRMIDEKLINKAGAEVVQAILSFKHTEEMPYPTRETVAELLGKTVDYVKKALKSIKETGILAVVKSGRKSKYDFKPFFALLEKFIVEFKQKKNKEVKISDLLKMKAVKKEAKDFNWSEEYKDAEKEVVPTEDVQEEGASEASEPVVLPEELTKVMEVYGITSEGVQAVQNAYTAYSGKLEVAVFVEKIVASKDKKNFVNYFEKCITTAYVNGEQPSQAPVQQTGSSYANSFRTPVRTEKLPEWLEENKRVEEAKKNGTYVAPEKPKTTSELIEEATTHEELDVVEAEIQSWLKMIPNHIQGNEEMEMIKEKRKLIDAGQIAK